MDTRSKFKIIDDVLYRRFDKTVIHKDGHFWYRCGRNIRVGNLTINADKYKSMLRDGTHEKYDKGTT